MLPILRARSLPTKMFESEEIQKDHSSQTNSPGLFKNNHEWGLWFMPVMLVTGSRTGASLQV